MEEEYYPVRLYQPEGKAIPFDVSKKCMSDTDLSLTENLEPIRDLVIFFFANARNKGECIYVSDLVESIRTQRRVWILGRKKVRYNQPVFKLPWSGVRIDYGTVKEVLMKGYNTILLYRSAEVPLESSFGMSQLHGALETIWGGRPVHRRSFISGNTRDLVMRENAIRPEDFLTVDPLDGKKYMLNGNEDEEMGEPRYLFLESNLNT